MSNFAMGTILGKGFPQAQVHTVAFSTKGQLISECPFFTMATLLMLLLENVKVSMVFYQICPA